MTFPLLPKFSAGYRVFKKVLRNQKDYHHIVNLNPLAFRAHNLSSGGLLLGQGSLDTESVYSRL